MTEHAHSVNGTTGGELLPAHPNPGEDISGLVTGDHARLHATGRWSRFEDIPVHGDALVGKADHVIRFYFENVDGFRFSSHNDKYKKHKINNKQRFLNHLFSRLEVDIFGGVEIRQQHDMIPLTQKISRQFDLRDGSKVQTSHNVHERFSAHQQGGTCIIANELVSSYVTEQGADPEGLGRWSWIKLAGHQNTTRVVVVYMPCQTRKQATHATMAQH